MIPWMPPLTTWAAKPDLLRKRRHDEQIVSGPSYRGVRAGLHGPPETGGSARRTHDPATTEELDFAFVGDGCGQADDGRSGLATSRA